MSEQIIWTVEKRRVADLKELENNPRKIKDEDFQRLKERIKARGFHDVVKLDTEGFVLSGNRRKQALKEVGIEEVNCLVPNRPLSKEERDAVIIESNRHDGMWDFDMLANNFETSDLIDWGFTMGELGMSDNNGKDKIDVDNMAQGLETYMNSDIKQIVIYVKGTEFADVLRRIESIMPELGADNHSEAFLKLLEEHENMA